MFRLSLKPLLLVVLAAAVAAAVLTNVGAAHGQTPPTGVLYALETTNDLLRSVDRNNGTTAQVSSTSPGVLAWGGLAWDGSNLYGVERTDNSLWTINRTTGAGSRVGDAGSLGDKDWLSLAWDGTNLYSVERIDDSLWRIDRSDGTAARVGASAGLLDAKDWRALAWDGTNLYALEIDDYSLWTIDRTAGTSSRVGNAGSLGAREWAGLAWDGSNLYAVETTTDSLWIVNRTNGTTTRQGVSGALGPRTWSGLAFAPAQQPPAAPAAPTVTAGDRSLAVSWTAPNDRGSPITDYDVRYKVTTDTAWNDWAVQEVTTSATITQLTNGLMYEVQVRAANIGGESNWSISGTGTPAAPAALALSDFATAGLATDVLALIQAAAPPVIYASPPRGTLGSLLDGELGLGTGNAPITRLQIAADGLTINDNSDLTLSSYFGTGGDGADLTLWIQTMSSTESVALSGALGNGGGGFQVVTLPAAMQTLVSGLEAGERFIIALTRSSLTVPGQVSAPALTPGNATFSASWTAPSDGGSAVTGYTYEVRAGTTGAWTMSANTASTTATIMPVTNGQLYQFRVRATNAQGDGPWSDPVSTTPMSPPAAPDTPLSPVLVTGDTELMVEWALPNENNSPITDYDVQYRLVGQSGWIDWAHTGPGRTATITGLTNDMEYEVRIRATNAEGTSGWSDPSAPATPNPPGDPLGDEELFTRTPPTAFTLFVNPGPVSSRIEMSWDSIPGASGYIIQTRDNGVFLREARISQADFQAMMNMTALTRIPGSQVGNSDKGLGHVLVRVRAYLMLGNGSGERYSPWTEERIVTFPETEYEVPSSIDLTRAPRDTLGVAALVETVVEPMDPDGVGADYVLPMFFVACVALSGGSAWFIGRGSWTFGGAVVGCIVFISAWAVLGPRWLDVPIPLALAPIVLLCMAGSLVLWKRYA